LSIKISTASSVEYTFADGARMIMDGRAMDGACRFISSYVHGSKGMAIAAKRGLADFHRAFSRAEPAAFEHALDVEAVPGQQDRIK